MSNATEKFFAALPECGKGLLPPEFRGTLRFDLRHEGETTDQWYVTIYDGNVGVLHEPNPTDRPADCIVQMPRPVFDRLATGRGSVVALTLSNQMTVQGSLPLILMFRRYFPPAPGSRDPRSLAAHGRGE